MDRLEFTSDWLSPWLPDWRRLFAPRLVGRPIEGLEIGCHEGRSAIWTLQHLLTHAESRLTCVDPWPQIEIMLRFERNLTLAGVRERADRHQRRSVQFLAEAIAAGARHRYDWVYIDGSHEGRDCLVDAALAFELLAPAGILCFDDYAWTATAEIQHPPRPAIDCFLQLWSPLIEVLHIGYQVAVVRREHPVS